MSTMDRDEFDRLLGEVEAMDEDALDAAVARATADYNAPPAGTRPPVEAMWTRIAATQRPATQRLATGGLQGRLHVQRWQLLAASVAFLAFGITIGRQWSGITGGNAGGNAPVGAHAGPAPHAAGTPATAPSRSTSDVTTPDVTPDVTTPAQVADAGSITTDVHHSVGSVPTQSTARPTTRPTAHAAGGVQDDGASGATSGATTVSRSDAAYQLATMRHFAAAEALLASYDGSARDAKTDAQLASWASDLLSQTRLLIDSPAGRDPVRRRLLQDLELVLVQMAQLSPDASKSAALEHELIDGSVRHNDIITRLRTAVPAGATTAL